MTTFVLAEGLPGRPVRRYMKALDAWKAAPRCGSYDTEKAKGWLVANRWYRTDHLDGKIRNLDQEDNVFMTVGASIPDRVYEQARINCLGRKQYKQKIS
ncbi:hypothetical protein PILCRDRAFT_312697 [Piloderma croceum F 1598]|uniref:Uncharacterized protein n=1 Tax=Piloderma croceum (strain F 1598) TaxID=765440 RepID=A0A0C3BK01_PILCF|nr:hypothetical protein PILCRDRAFT_312697 [Piloderma croceum F 1598]